MASEQKPVLSSHIHDDLNESLRANDRDRAIDLYYQLLSSGRPLSEIIAAGVQNDRTSASGESDQTVAAAPGGPSISRQPAGSTAIAERRELAPAGSARPRTIEELLVGRAAFSTEGGNPGAVAASGTGPVLPSQQGSLDAPRDLNST